MENKKYWYNIRLDQVYITNTYHKDTIDHYPKTYSTRLFLMF